MHRGLRIPGLRKGDDSPLRTWLLHQIRNACPTPWLPTPRRRRCGRNVTSPTRSRPSTAERFTQSAKLCCRDVRHVRVISREICAEICDAVRLTNTLVCPDGGPRGRADLCQLKHDLCSIENAGRFWDVYFHKERL